MIKLFALDIDGTLTDGGVYMDGLGNEYKRFNTQDGYGLTSLIKSGVKVVFISGRYSPATQRRAQELNITVCINGTNDKLTELKKIAIEYKISKEEIAYAGDDIPDLECIKWAGVGIATKNSVVEIKESADWCTEQSGGNGAIRECAEYIHKINGGSL
ncbi:MAG: HAD-IIIA family hydrolase [Synergistaceae bacterium]|jgi:3-deoxy-D-manno-octulosonate 8-phosphate phosphatase (KDO 8-P phosphatase)|nr:HAD-IIIA family hydrolase [Synergistaceae bacterium]